MLDPTPSIWHNGKLVPWDEAKIHVLTHALHYGGGAFEGIRFYETAQGPAIFRLNEHIERLFYSASVLRMEIPYSHEEIAEAIKEVVKSSKLDSGYIRPIVYFGYGKMGVNPIGSPVEFAIACWSWGSYLPHESIDITVSKYIRIHPDSTVVDAKLTGHYLNGILASLELQGTHYHEALFLDSKGYITEGVGENFFIIKNNQIFTPRLGEILCGITRETIMQLVKKLGYSIVEKDLTLEDAYDADEAFFTGTAAEVTPIRSINDRTLKNLTTPISTAIKNAYLDVVHGKNEEFSQFLTIVYN